jgi:hypothetical protein
VTRVRAGCCALYVLGARHDAFLTLCGPGAADVALYYWPWPPNLHDYTQGIVEYLNNTRTVWNGRDRDGILRMRGYMLHLAYEIQPPTWPRAGLNMQQADWDTQPLHRGKGATLSVMKDALNWEASGEGSLGTWSTYFYYTVFSNFSNGGNGGVLHDDVFNDIVLSNEPVVLLVNTNGLQNWGFSSGVWHFITIIGYNDDYQGGPVYMYTDSCASVTGCGSNTNGQVQIGKQSDLYNNSSGWDW